MHEEKSNCYQHFGNILQYVENFHIYDFTEFLAQSNKAGKAAIYFHFTDKKTLVQRLFSPK